MSAKPLSSANPFADSDDEEESPEEDDSNDPSASDPFAGTICKKVRNSSAGSEIYFVDYTKVLQMDPSDAQQLRADLMTALEEVRSLERSIADMESTTKTLSAQPTNEKLFGLIKQSEYAVKELKAAVEDTGGFKSNEGRRIELGKRIRDMTAHWRKRKGLCLAAISQLADLSDGAISLKNFDITTDEEEIKSALTLYERQKLRGGKAGKAVSSNIIGVRLDGMDVIRVLADGNETKRSAAASASAPANKKPRLQASADSSRQLLSFVYYLRPANANCFFLLSPPFP